MKVLFYKYSSKYAFLSLFLIAFFSSISLFAQQKPNADNHGRGLLLEEEVKESQKIQLKSQQTEESYRGLPSAVSLKQYCPTPGDQGSYGTCVGWTTAYAARTILEARQLDLRSQAEIDKLIFSPGFIYKLVKEEEDQDCTYGAIMTDALKKMQVHGVAKRSSFPEQCVDYVPERTYKEAEEYKLKDYVRLWNIGFTQEERILALKKSLTEGNPVVVGMEAPPSIYQAQEFWRPTEIAGQGWGGHAICVVGFDDKKGEKGSFEIMNSWGTGWANGGFTWIEYDTFTDFVRFAYELVPYYKPKKERPLLAGSLRFELANGNKIELKKNGVATYKTPQPFSGGTNFRLYLSNFEPAYVYAFATDKTKNVQVVFPHKAYISPFLPYHNGEIAFPDEKHYLTMDNVAGTDYFCVIYSRYPLDINDIYQKLGQRKGTLKEGLEQVLGNKLVSTNEVAYSQNEVKFSTSSLKGTAAFFVVELEHK
ncbi:C1 family peptidase [Bernardetia sp. MNP-M8]|uniref:C1 family peptidase n=1 Tax=Bernardetia sp. MNP-M8 TaxID=3127470 RepID=UPI0030CAB3DC